MAGLVRLDVLISHQSNSASPFALHEPAMRSFGILPEVFRGRLHFPCLHGIDLGKQILIFLAIKIILQGTDV
jgi:hypothetical protein